MDKKKAIKYYKLAVEQGHAGAQYNGGRMYVLGDGVEHDLAEALKRFELAAAQGHQESQEAVAFLQGEELANARRCDELRTQA